MSASDIGRAAGHRGIEQRLLEGTIRIVCLARPSSCPVIERGSLEPGSEGSQRRVENPLVIADCGVIVAIRDILDNVSTIW